MNVSENATMCASKNQAAEQLCETNQLDDANMLLSTLIEKRKDRISPHTHQGDEILLKHLTNYGGEHLTVADVNPEFCKGFAEYMMTDGRLQRSSAKYFLQKFHALMRDAIYEGCIPANPMPPIPRLIAKGVSVERESLTVDEVLRLSQTPCRHTITQLAFLFSVFTGLRLSDVETLRWENIVKANGGYLVKKVQVKTNGEVRVPLGHHAKETLAKVREGHLDKDGFIFPLYTRPTTSKDLNQWVKAANIDKHITFHVSRISFVTLSLAAHVNIVIVSKLCGHKDIKTTQMYARIVDKTFVKAINSLDGLFDNGQDDDDQMPTYWGNFNSVL